MADRAKIFTSGGSQAVRLPKAYRFENGREVRRFSATPIVEKENARRFTGHVRMDRHDVDTADTKRFQRSLKFISRYGEIAIYNRVVVAAGERSPGVHAHFLIDVCAVHFCRATDREFHHAVFGLALCAEYFVERFSRD